MLAGDARKKACYQVRLSLTLHEVSRCEGAFVSNSYLWSNCVCNSIGETLQYFKWDIIGHWLTS